MNTRTTILFVSTLLSVACNAFSANPADLTVFDRFDSWREKGWGKVIWDEAGMTEFIALPRIENFGVSFQGWQSAQNDSQKLIGRFTTAVSEGFDVGLNTEISSMGDISKVNNRIFLDMHGKVFGMPAGLGLMLPFDKKENFKAGPRICVTKEITLFATIDEESKYALGATFSKWGCKLELAHSSEEISYIRASRGFKTPIGLVCPEFRLNLLPNGQVYGAGVGIFF